MTARPAPSLWHLLVVRIRLKLLMWRYFAQRALIRLIRRAIDWLEPAD